jgi:hypothetical protein
VGLPHEARSVRKNKDLYAERSVVRALPACLEAGLEAVEEELDAELETLIAVRDDRVGHGGDDRDAVRGQPAEIVPDRAQVLLHLASGSLSSVQQLANAIGPAIITTIYFGALRGGQAHAMTVSLGAVIGIGVLSAMAVPLLPRRAQAGAG